MNLLRLSLTHCPPRAPVAPPPTPEERLSAFRAAVAPLQGNSVFRFTPTHRHVRAPAPRSLRVLSL